MIRVKNPKVRWIKSWHEFPNKDKASNQRGFSDAKTGDIYAIKGVTRKNEIEHEKYHSMKGHPNQPYKPINHVRDEIEAYVYAYSQTGQPNHILMVLRALFNDQVLREYRISPRQAIINIRKILLKYEGRYPDTWKDDYNKLLIEYNKAYKQKRK
jgi:hypothetical protein